MRAHDLMQHVTPIYLSVCLSGKGLVFLRMSMSILDIYEAPVSPGTCCPGDWDSFSAVATTNRTVATKSVRRRYACAESNAERKARFSCCKGGGRQERKLKREKQLFGLINTAVFIYKVVLSALIPGLFVTCEKSRAGR